MREQPSVDMQLTIVPDGERTPEWTAIWRRLLAPLAATATCDQSQASCATEHHAAVTQENQQGSEAT
jgi:hypothetical protein